METFEALNGRIIESIDLLPDLGGDANEVIFNISDGEKYRLYHEQDCCESVYLEDVTGDLGDLIGSPILLAEEIEGESRSGDFESCTWTFYKLATIKGSVTLRWVGVSNGYYSERVDFGRVSAH